MWSLAVPFRAILIQGEDDILISALGQGTENSLKSFMWDHQRLPSCRGLSGEWEVCWDMRVPPNYPLSSSAPARPCLLQIALGKTQLLVGPMLWPAMRRKLHGWPEHEAQRMHPMQFANLRQATKALSKWGGTTTHQAKTSPTPWLLWGHSHYHKKRGQL